jgi:hypothetical protein
VTAANPGGGEVVVAVTPVLVSGAGVLEQIFASGIRREPNMAECKVDNAGGGQVLDQGLMPVHHSLARAMPDVVGDIVDIEDTPSGNASSSIWNPYKTPSSATSKTRRTRLQITTAIGVTKRGPALPWAQPLVTMPTNCACAIAL